MQISGFYGFEIPLPPLEVQNGIVEEIEQYQKVIDGAKQVISNYRPTISINPDWEIVKLGDICLKVNNGVFKKREEFGRGVKLINVSDLYKSLAIDTNSLERVDVTEKELQLYSVEKDDLFFCRSSLKKEGIGWCAYIDKLEEPIVFECHLMRVQVNKSIINPRYLAIYWQHPIARENLIENSRSATMTTMNQNDLLRIEIPRPPLEIQNAIVEEIEKERAAVEACKQLVAQFETKIKTKIAKIWGEEL